MILLSHLITQGCAVRGVKVRWMLYGKPKEGEVQCLNSMGMAIVLYGGAEYPVDPTKCEVVGD